MLSVVEQQPIRLQWMVSDTQNILVKSRGSENKLRRDVKEKRGICREEAR